MKVSKKNEAKLMNDINQPPVISVVIPCRNHAKELRDCLRAATQQSLKEPYEVILVDSASEAAIAEVAAEFPSVRLVRSIEPLGPGPARNRGVEEARGTYLAFTDADCIPEPQWLEAAVEALRAGAHFIAGPFIDAVPDNPIAVSDNILQFSDFRPERPVGPIEFWAGGNIALEQETFDRVGGFPDIRIGQDVAFTKKVIAEAPDQSVFVPEMRVAHVGRQTLGEFWGHQIAFGYARAKRSMGVTPVQIRMGAWRIFAPAIIVKRLLHILCRTFSWSPKKFPKILLLLPFLIYRLTGYAVGFRRGCLANQRPNA